MRTEVGYLIMSESVIGYYMVSYWLIFNEISLVISTWNIIGYYSVLNDLVLLVIN